LPIAWSEVDRAYVRRQFEKYRLSVAGAPIRYHEETATQAAQTLLGAAWFLVNRDEPEESVNAVVAMPGLPASAAEQLSADLFLRFLPVIHRRARVFGPQDALTQRLEDLLRRWPLSGVLADVTDAPLAPLDFHGHPGLQWLYAERLAQHPKPAWAPPELTGQRLEWVLAESGRDPALLSAPRRPAPESKLGKDARSDFN
jgi:hypothetical protein